MDSRNDMKIINIPIKSKETFKTLSEIQSFYSTFDNFMKNKIKNKIANENQNQSEPYSLSKLMNSLHEYSKKRPDFDLKITNDRTMAKKQKIFQGLSLKNFSDNSSKEKQKNPSRKIIKSHTSNSTLYLNRKYEKKEEKNNSKEDLEEIKKYEILEKLILKLKDNIGNYEQFSLICNEWMDKLWETKWGISKIIKVNKIYNDISEKERSINLLIISIIASFLLIYKLENNHFQDKEIIINNLTEIIIVHHKIYLLLCYDILLRNKNSSAFLLEKINEFLPKKIYLNNNKSSCLEEEIISCNLLFSSMLKSILTEIQTNIIEIFSNDLSNIFSLDSTKLINLFKKIYQAKGQKLYDVNNKINLNLSPVNKTEKNRVLFEYKSKKIFKKNILINEKDSLVHSNNNTFNNFYLKQNYTNNYNNSLNNNDIKYRKKNYYKSLNSFNTKKNIETEKINENIYLRNKKINSLTNSYSCREIPPFPQSIMIEQNKKVKINVNENNMNNKSANKINNNCLKNINSKNEINNENKELNSKKNNTNTNNINKPKPPFLTSNILYSKYNKKNFTLILDLDETLIKYIQNVNFPKGKILFRPGLIQFLNKSFIFFDLIIWTVATKDYADKIINNIEKERKFFTARLYREHATHKNNLYIKDLANLGRPLDKIIIIDDKESSFSLQRNNGILIRPFQGTKKECQNDYVLMDLYNILTKIIFDRSKDVRIGISKYKKEIFEKISKLNNNNFQQNNINN